MYRQSALAQQIAPALYPLIDTSEVKTVLLNADQETEALAFLAERPLHTVVIVGLIRDNGIRSTLNRGDFYGCWNRKGELEGVALIGHATLLETRTDRALQAFAEIAQQSAKTHMILGSR